MISDGNIKFLQNLVIECEDPVKIWIADYI